MNRCAPRLPCSWLWLALLAAAAACGPRHVKERAPEVWVPEKETFEQPKKRAALLDEGWADVWCMGDEPGVKYNAPGYDEMSEGLGKDRPVIRWKLSDLGGGGKCHLLGVPDRKRTGDAKYVLRSVKSFELRGERCVCRPVRTRIQEGIFRPKKRR
jgi:hypothetical protein